MMVIVLLLDNIFIYHHYFVYALLSLIYINITALLVIGGLYINKSQPKFMKIILHIMNHTNYLKNTQNPLVAQNMQSLRNCYSPLIVFIE